MESPRIRKDSRIPNEGFPLSLLGSHHVEGSHHMGLEHSDVYGNPRCAKLRKNANPAPKKKQRHGEKKHAKPGNLGCFMDAFCSLFAKKINKQHPTRAIINNNYYKL